MIISKLELRNLSMNYKFSEREVEIKNSNAVKTSKKKSNFNNLIFCWFITEHDYARSSSIG